MPTFLKGIVLNTGIKFIQLYLKTSKLHSLEYLVNDEFFILQHRKFKTEDRHKSVAKQLIDAR